MQIGLIKIWPVDKNKTLIGKADVSFTTEHGEFSVKNFRIVQIDGKPAFVGGPQEKYLVNGVPKYKEILWLDRKFQGFLYEKILAAFNSKKPAN